MPEAAVGPPAHKGQSDVADQATGVGDHQMPLRPQNAYEFRQHRVDVGHVTQCKRAQHKIRRVIGQRQLVDLRLVERSRGHPPARHLEHLG
jgi:hypothetical protein